MNEIPGNFANEQTFQQADFEKITQLVAAEFQIQEALLENGTPTYYLKWPQETKHPFLRLLQRLEEMKLSAFLRKADGRIVLKVVLKPPVKPSNPRIYWLLFFATIATTFISGYFNVQETGINPFIGGAIFSAAILTVLGIHEMGHKLTANRKKVEATSPYFIPGPPPLGTIGAVIVQKSLPPNKDTLFDIGANGPIAGFIIAIVFSTIGLTLLIPTTIPAGSEGGFLMPISWIFLMPALSGMGLIPQPIPPNNGWFLHPITYAGWAGMIVTMLNLLPAAMLDGGHVARSVASDKQRFFLTLASVLILVLSGTEFIIMAFLIVFMSMVKHPGPLDDVSSLSRNRKLLTIALVAFFILAFPIRA